MRECWFDWIISHVNYPRSTKKNYFSKLSCSLWEIIGWRTINPQYTTYPILWKYHLHCSSTRRMLLPQSGSSGLKMLQSAAHSGETIDVQTQIGTGSDVIQEKLQSYSQSAHTHTADRTKPTAQQRHQCLLRGRGPSWSVPHCCSYLIFCLTVRIYNRTKHVWDVDMNPKGSLKSACRQIWWVKGLLFVA